MQHCLKEEAGLTLPVGGVNNTSSPTSKGLLDRMMSPVNRFSRISLPARPTARPPTPPMANTLFTAATKLMLVSVLSRQHSATLC